MFELLLNSICMLSRLYLFFFLFPTKCIFHSIWCCAQQQKLRERRRKEGCLWLRGLSSQVPMRYAEAMLSRRWLGICLLMGNSEWLLPFALLVCTALLHLVICLYLKPPVLRFVFLILCPPLPVEGVSERLGGSIAAGWGQPNTMDVSICCCLFPFKYVKLINSLNII